MIDSNSVNTSVIPHSQLMLRGLPHLAKYMPEIKDARRLIPNPESELDFESISKVFPLPDTQAKALELALTQNTGASTVGDSGLQQQQQFQGATNNNWASIPPMFPAASTLEASQACDAMRAKDAVSAALYREAELGAQEQHNVALLIELAARRQQQAGFDAREQQANPGNAALASLVDSMLKTPSRFGCQ
jgi:hypothetical protein